ncbi:MAG: integrase [Burkholderiaceae bacterium]
MLNPVNPIDHTAAARLLEFLGPSPPWNRSLWNIGLVLELHELHEACEAFRNSILSEKSVCRLVSSFLRKAGKDPVLTREEKAHLREQLQQPKPPHVGSAQHHAIRQMADRLQRDYLMRWAQIVRGEPNYGLENFARSVAAHLLDHGFSRAHLQETVRAALRTSDSVTLAEICEQLQAEIRTNQSRQFEVLIGFQKSPRHPGGYPRGWMNGHMGAEWLIANGFDTSNLRISAATVLTVTALDPRGAAEAAASESDRLAARTIVATGQRLERLKTVWVRGHPEPFPLFGDARGVRVKALAREDLIYEPTQYKNIDAAIELMAHLEGSSPAAAIAGGWAAIEGLLAEPDARATAADNLAALVACSWPRAELTTLSYTVQKHVAQYAVEFDQLRVNRERCMRLAELIHDGQIRGLDRRPADTAAILRVSKVLNNPRSGLQDIKETVAEAFHRLYRQRNLILHGGNLDGVSLRASLRTVAKLAGAGLDRIAHAQYVQQVIPLELVSRANMGLALLDNRSTMACVDLLEPHVSGP